MADDGVAHVVRKVLAVIPAGCSWLLPVTEPGGAVIDFRIGGASGAGNDIYRRGTSRVDGLLSELYPSIVGGRLWQIYLSVLRTGEPDVLKEFRYEQQQSGAVAHAVFDVSVHPVLGGLLVWWQRLDETRRRMDATELLGSLGWAEHDLATGANEWSPGMYRIFDRDPGLGPMSRVEQAALLYPEDRGLAEVAWQTMDTGATADITVRFRVGATTKHLRILSDTVLDATGQPLKINAVVQDVTARENSRTAIDMLRDQVHARELTAIAEHRLAGRLQHMIQPVPPEPFPLAGLEALVGYLPAENSVRVGGDWYLAQDLPDGRVVLAVGDMAGHGLGAANGMAHLRFALLAWLSIGIDEPAVLLGHLNQMCVRLRLTGTAALGVYHPPTGALCWSRAGHAAPLLGRAGTACELDPPAGLLLGAEGDAAYPERTTRLTPGDVLLFYTDGLVERRGAGEPLLPGVLEVLAEASAADGDALDRLADQLHRPSPDDDTCTLAVRVL
ncbi:MAG: SpoIIE family protein phosphatase [Actinoplanes sp.]